MADHDRLLSLLLEYEYYYRFRRTAFIRQNNEQGYCKYTCSLSHNTQSFPKFTLVGGVN